MAFELPPLQSPSILFPAENLAPGVPVSLRSMLSAMAAARAAAPVEDPFEITTVLLEQIRDEMKALAKRQRGDRDVAVPIEEAQRMLGCGRTALWKLRGEGKLHEAKRVGRKVMIMTDSINLLLASGYTPERTTTRRMRTPSSDGVKRVRLSTTRLPA